MFSSFTTAKLLFEEVLDLYPQEHYDQLRTWFSGP